MRTSMYGQRAKTMTGYWALWRAHDGRRPSSLTTPPDDSIVKEMRSCTRPFIRAKRVHYKKRDQVPVERGMGEAVGHAMPHLLQHLDRGPQRAW